jgi:hypothetical protein
LEKGFCLNFVSQYDIDLILSVEKKINSTIQEIFIDEDDIMSEISLVSQAVKIKMKIYESGFEEKNKNKNYQKHGIIHPKDRNNKKS